MKNILSILRRDLGAYFTSPIGYIFIMVFITISVGLYITSFFMMRIADMRPYFDNLPLLLCVFIPAVTMRVWAEERKENTWEMLLTFPMKASELALGKFFAALIFFAITLAATITVPLMLYALGKPDTGGILCGYVGTLLLGAFFLALGIFFSGFFMDQIVAFVVTLLTCFLFFLLGIDFIASYVDDKLPGLGRLLSDLLGVFTHFTPFTRGVIDIADVLFFLVWTALFLVLNIMYIDGRNRPGARLIFSSAVGVSLAIGFLFNYLMVGQSLLRFDMTQDKIYTISTASKAILSEATEPVHLKLYITPREEMPTAMKKLEQDIADKFEELRVASNAKIDYTTIYMRAANVFADQEEKPEDKEKGKTEEEAIEKRMLEKGVKPFNVQAMSQDKMTNELVYSSIGVAYKDKPEEIIPAVMPQSLDEIEYRVVSTVYKLTKEKRSVVALVAPKEAVNIDPQMRQILMQMGQPIPQSEDPYIYLERILGAEKYDVKRVELTKENPLPDEYDTLVVVNPRSLDDRQRWEINRAIRSGKSVVLAVQDYEWEYEATPRGNTVRRRDEKPEINPLLGSYGLGVSDDVLMDMNSVPLRVQGGSDLMSMLQGGQPFNLPMHILVSNESMDPNISITSRLSQVFYLWGTALKLDQDKLKQNGLQAKVIMNTSNRAWTLDSKQPLTKNSFKEPPENEMKQYPLMAVVEGQFPDAYAGKDRPAWPKPEQRPGEPPAPETPEKEEAPKPIEAKPGKMILLGCSEMFRKNFIEGGGSANLDLFLNCVDVVSLSENLANVRGRKPIDRTINEPSANQKFVWRLTNYGLANVVFAGIGISLFAIRRRSRNAYTMGQMARSN